MRTIIILSILLFTFSESANAQTRELRQQFISKYGGATYRLPTILTSFDSKFSDFVYIRDDGVVFGISFRGFTDSSQKTPRYVKNRRSRVSVKPFNSRKKIGVCLGASNCHDINEFSSHRSWNGDPYQLQSGALKKSLSLLGL